MDIYQGWCDLKPGVRDTVFVDAFSAYMEGLKSRGVIEGWRLMRRKLGLGPRNVGDGQGMF